MRKIAVILTILLLTFGGCVIANDEVKVPLSAIKSSCYDQIDMSKAEFPLSRVGRECVKERWLEENKPGDKSSELAEKVYVRQTSDLVSIGNSFFEISFKKDEGTIWSFVKKDTQTELIKNKEESWPVTWNIVLVTPDNEEISSNSDHAKDFDFWSEEIETGKVLHLVWDGLRLRDGGSYSAKVHATITVHSDNSFSEWSIKGENYGNAVVTKLTFPEVPGITKLGSSSKNDYYFHPGMDGRLYNNMWNNKMSDGSVRGTYPSANASMQFVSLYDKQRGGFYLSVRDDKGHHKTFEFSHWDKFIAWNLLNHPISLEGAKFEVPYDIRFGVYEGGWQEAADIYKKWALNQWWAEKKVTKKSPEWLRNTSASNQFMCHTDEQNIHHSYDEFADVTINHSEHLGKPMLGELWGWEKHGTFEGYGDYFPPYNGWQVFEEGVNKVKSAGSQVRVFIRASGMSMEVPPWANPESQDASGKDIRGNPITHGNTARMDISTEYWQDKLKDYSVKLAKHGVNQIQLDGFPLKRPLYCYDRDHNHPLGRKGNWYTQNWITTLKSIRSSVKKLSKQVTLASEGIAEPFIPYVDAYHLRESWADVGPEGGKEIRKGYARVVPAFPYVYHQNIIPLGQFNKLLSRRFNTRYHLLGLSRILKWGKLPSYNFRDPLPSPDLNEEAFELLKNITHIRQNEGKNYLVSGKMIKAPTIESPTTKIPLKFPNQNIDTTLEVPAIQYSAWKSSDGSIGLVLTNIAESSVGVNIPLLPDSFDALEELKLENKRLVVVSRDEKEVLPIPDSGVLSLELQPLKVTLLKVMEPRTD
ncbi:hypothetical protein KGY79_12380 [Candidatus Bipolaricaulota bacterium]|nr:hypothetical protein [Candidatus Bipolaricaulota bacterium]